MTVNKQRPDNLQRHTSSFSWLHITIAIAVTITISLTMGITVSPAIADENISKANPNDKTQVSRGKVVYDRFCSLCHGKDLKGQPNWRKRNKNGRLPAPPHDSSGHTWHHDDALLFGMTKYGIVPPYGPKGYESDMPAWKDTLSDADIWASLAYIKSRWPEELQQAQDRRNQASDFKAFK